MARLVTAGFESQSSKGTEGPKPFAATTGYGFLDPVGTAPTFDTGIFRSGAVSMKCNTGAIPTGSGYKWNLPQQASVTIYHRCYFRFEGLPTGAALLISSLTIGGTAAGGGGVKITSGGKFQLWNMTTDVQVGSDSAATVTAGDGVWYRVEISNTYNATPQVTGFSAQIDGVTLASASGLSISATGVQGFFVGWPDATVDINVSDTNLVMYADDLAINDSSGSAQNSWPGDGKIVLLVPTSDNAAGSWRAGSAASAAANGALYDAINNKPPVGTATPDAVTACISNAVSGATTPNGDFNMTTYSAAGIASGDTINCLAMIIAHGEDVATSAKTGTFKIFSNPDSGTADTVGDSNTSQFGPTAGGAVAAYASASGNWVTQLGTVIYAPSVTLGSAPVARITKVDTGTRAADCCFMGIYVDYTPAAVVSAVPYYRTPLLGPILAQ
jgi:hypothetical protein